MLDFESSLLGRAMGIWFLHSSGSGVLISERAPQPGEGPRDTPTRSQRTLEERAVESTGINDALLPGERRNFEVPGPKQEAFGSVASKIEPKVYSSVWISEAGIEPCPSQPTPLFTPVAFAVNEWEAKWPEHCSASGHRKLSQSVEGRFGVQHRPTQFVAEKGTHVQLLLLRMSDLNCGRYAHSLQLPLC